MGGRVACRLAVAGRGCRVCCGGRMKLRLGRGAIAGCDGREMISLTDGHADARVLRRGARGVFAARAFWRSRGISNTARNSRNWRWRWRRRCSSRMPLVAEAGTGVGKSLAYLLPAARFALETGRKGVISTHTINLQEQLVRKDIPIVRKLVGDELPAVLLKGRQNYLCPLRLRRALEQSGDLFTGAENDELEAIRKWAEATRDGTLSDLDFQPQMKVWLQVCSEAHLCTARHCGPRGNCFFQEARKAAADAKLVVVNHTLFFALLNTETGSRTTRKSAKKTKGFLVSQRFRGARRGAHHRAGGRRPVRPAGVPGRVCASTCSGSITRGPARACSRRSARPPRCWRWRMRWPPRSGFSSSWARWRTSGIFPRNAGSASRRWCLTPWPSRCAGCGRKSTPWRRTWRAKRRARNCRTRPAACARPTVRWRCFSIKPPRTACIGSSAAAATKPNTACMPRR